MRLKSRKNLSLTLLNDAIINNGEINFRGHTLKSKEIFDARSFSVWVYWSYTVYPNT